MTFDRSWSSHTSAMNPLLDLSKILWQHWPRYHQTIIVHLFSEATSIVWKPLSSNKRQDGTKECAEVCMPDCFCQLGWKLWRFIELQTMQEPRWHAKLSRLFRISYVTYFPNDTFCISPTVRSMIYNHFPIQIHILIFLCYTHNLSHSLCLPPQFMHLCCQ